MTKKRITREDLYVGSRVRQARLLRGMSQTALGDKLKLTFQQIQKYEKGVNRIGAGRLWEVSHILGVPITYFFEGLEQFSGAPPAMLSSKALDFAGQFDALPDHRRAQVAPVIQACLRSHAEKDSVRIRMMTLEVRAEAALEAAQ